MKNPNKSTVFWQKWSFLAIIHLFLVTLLVTWFVYPLYADKSLSQSIQDPGFSIYLGNGGYLYQSFGKTFWFNQADWKKAEIHSGLDGVVSSSRDKFILQTIDGYFGYHALIKFDNIDLRYRFIHHSAHISEYVVPYKDPTISFSREYSRFSLEKNGKFFNVYIGGILLTHTIPEIVSDTMAGWGIYGGYSIFKSIYQNWSLVNSGYLEWSRENNTLNNIYLTTMLSMKESLSFGIYYYKGHDIRGQFWKVNHQHWGILISLHH